MRSSRRSSLYGLNAGIIDKTQFSLLVAVVVLSAVVPTAIAERWFLPDAERERREDRDLAAQVFDGFGVTRSGPRSPRRAKPRPCRSSARTLWLGHSPQEHLRTYAHATLADRRELNYSEMLERVRGMHTPMHT